MPSIINVRPIVSGRRRLMTQIGGETRRESPNDLGKLGSSRAIPHTGIVRSKKLRRSQHCTGWRSVKDQWRPAEKLGEHRVEAFAHPRPRSVYFKFYN